MRSINQQKGDFLIEAMIGTLITALVSLGTLAITSHVMLTQEDMARQEAIVIGLREHLYSPKASCVPVGGEFVPATGKINLPGGTKDVSSQCAAHNEIYSINGKNYPVELNIVASSLTIVGPKSEEIEYGLGFKNPEKAVK